MFIILFLVIIAFEFLECSVLEFMCNEEYLNNYIINFSLLFLFMLGTSREKQILEVGKLYNLRFVYLILSWDFLILESS